MSTISSLLCMENVIASNTVFVRWVEVLFFLRLVNFLLATEELGRLQQYCDIACTIVAGLFVIYLLLRLICRHPLVWRILDCFSCQWMRELAHSLTEHLANVRCRISQELLSHINGTTLRNFSLAAYEIMRHIVERIRRIFSSYSRGGGSARYFPTPSSAFSSDIDDKDSENYALLSAPEPLVMERQNESKEAAFVADETCHDKKA